MPRGVARVRPSNSSPRGVFVFHRVDPVRDDHAEQAAVERHAAFPDLVPARRVELVVEEDVAEAAADEDAEDAPEQDVGHLRGLDGPALALGQVGENDVGADEREHVRQPVPPDLDRAERDDDRIDARVRDFSQPVHGFPLVLLPGRTPDRAAILPVHGAGRLRFLRRRHDGAPRPLTAPPIAPDARVGCEPLVGQRLQALHDRLGAPPRRSSGIAPAPP